MSSTEEESTVKHRGRKNIYDLTVVPTLPGQQRPDPPEHLTPEEAKVWNMSVGGMRPTWFNPASEAMLEGYCVQVATGQKIAAELRGVDIKTEYPRFAKLARIHRDVTRSILSLATKLRLTPSSNRQGIAEARVAYSGPKPWEPRDPA
jgi:phage terminase small subunit